MSGEKRNNVTVKMNGKFWEEKRESSADQRTPKELPPRVRIQGPPISIPGPTHVKKGNDAYDRMMQLREMEVREAPKETEIPKEPEKPDIAELYEGTYGESFGRGKISRLLSDFPKGPVLQTVLTTGGAIAIGLLFGFLVLTVFTKEEFSESYRNVLEDTVQTLTAASPDDAPKIAGPVLPGVTGSAGQSAPAASAPVGTGSEVPLQLPEISVFVAQAGVFQKDAAPDAVVEPLNKMGIPHLLYKDSAKQYMFAAVAPTRDAVLGFATSLKNKGMDVYVKEFSFPAFQGAIPIVQAQTAGANPDVSGFFSKGVKLIQTLSAHSGLIITTGQLSSTPQETATLKEQHRQFLETSRVVQVPETMKPQFTAMLNGVDQAMAAREKMAEASAGKKVESAESYAWQVQAGVLEYLEGYASLLQQAEKKE
ncbi:hypothetical protein [Brevibacillus reuszeri]|uniref:hypothetical protein n=1 Tax=Brevibacillus reuszeri TaxID=54915 RepID=UPI00289CE748|nr:hypothetical protein [Brevibacillus reuszeri]